MADRQRNRLEKFGKALQQQTGRIFADQHRRLELAATTIKYVDPKNVLERGYSITRLNGKAVRKAAVLQDRQPGNDETDPDPAKTEGRTDGAAEGVCGVSEKLGWMERQRAEACRLMISCRLL